MARSVKIVGGMSTKIISENPTEKKTGESHWVNKPPLKLEHRSLENSQDLGTAYKLEGREQEVRCMCWMSPASLTFRELRCFLFKHCVVQNLQPSSLLPQS